METLFINMIASKNALIIFTRNPELGKVKTRLAAIIGNQSALEIYKLLINHTVRITSTINADKYVFPVPVAEINKALSFPSARK